MRKPLHGDYLPYRHRVTGEMLFLRASRNPSVWNLLVLYDLHGEPYSRSSVRVVR